MKYRGFTLVEMAVVLVIFGTLLGAGLKLLSTQAERTAIELTKKRQETIKQALTAYLGRVGRLPCPDQNAIPDGLDNADRTAATPASCVAQFGAVPYIDLGLDRDVALDGWDNFMVYVVSPGWQNSYTTGANTQYQNNVPANTFWPGARQGAITVYDRIPATNAATTVIANPATGTGAAVAIVSYGKNGFGARNLSYNVNVGPAAGTDEEANTIFAGLQIAKREYTDQNIAIYGAFDDVVLPISASDFLDDLVKSGTLREVGSSAVLNAANDYAIGQIMASKAMCVVGCIPGDYYYTLPATLPNPFPAEALGWNATFVGNPNNIYTHTNAVTNAYTISVSDGLNTYQKAVTLAELKATLARVSGFH